MFLKVANNDVASFKNNNQWLAYHPNEALIFKDLKNVWSELKVIYNGDFKNLVYGELPKEGAILETLKMIHERLKSRNLIHRTKTRKSIYRIVESRKIFLSPWHYKNSISREKRNLVYIYLIGLNLIKSKNGNS